MSANPRIAILQTANEGMGNFLEATREIHERQCRRYGQDFIQEIGECVSGLPQFNRYFHLFKMWKLGLWDYVLYLDADAMIADLGNSIPDLFEDLKEDAAEDEDVLVHVTSLHKRGTPKWGVKSEAFLFNNGVFLLNMKHSCVGHFLKQMMSAAKGELGTEVWGIQLYRIDGHGNQLCDQHIMRLYMMAINKMSAVSVVKSQDNRDGLNYCGHRIFHATNFEVGDRDRRLWALQEGVKEVKRIGHIERPVKFQRPDRPRLDGE